MAEAEENERITAVPFDPSVPVITAWDLGIDDTTVIWFAQRVGREIHLIDFVESSGDGLDVYAKILKEKDYLYEEHLLPHDAAAKELGTGKTRQETLKSLGIKNTRIVPRQAIEDGINASRMLIPKCWFDAEKCEKGINALKNYERKWDSKNKIFQGKPLHNWASHAADAFRTLAMGLREDYSEETVRKYPRMAQNDFDLF